MKFGKKLVAVLLAATMVLSLAACSSSESSSEGESSGSTESTEASGEETSSGESGETKLTFGLYNSLDTLNPWVSAQITGEMVRFCMYETLASSQAGSTDLDYILMKDYEQTDDYTFEVELYDYIKDAAGNNITANDVKFSFEEYAKNNDDNFAELNVKDDYNIEIVLDTPAEGTFEYYAQKVCIASEDAYNDSPDQFATTSCGTMPYTCEGGSDYVNGASITLRATDSYWQTDESLVYEGSKQNADVIEFQILTESTQLALAIEQGTVDAAQFVEANLLDEVGGTDNVELVQVPLSEDRGFMFCMTEDSPFYNNLPLRQAILYAINDDEVAEACGYGYGSGSVVTSGNKDMTIGYDESWENDYYHYDPDKAKELLEEAGYNGETIRLLCNDNKTITTMWQTIQAELMAVGINAELNTVEGTTYGTYRNGTYGEYELCYAGPGNAGYVTQDLWNTLFNADKYEGLTWAGLDDPTLQEMYKKLTEPGGYTQENLNDFYNYITENAYYYQVYDLPWYAAIRTDKVEDYFIDHLGYIRANTIVLK